MKAALPESVLPLCIKNYFNTFPKIALPVLNPQTLFAYPSPIKPILAH